MAKLTTYQVTEIAKDTWVINEAGMTAMFLLKGTEPCITHRYGCRNDRPEKADFLADSASL